MLYGSDALGGVINIITRKPTFDEAWGLHFERAGALRAPACASS